VCIQGAVYEAVPGRLPFEYESLGEQQLKGFSEPVRAYAVSLKSGEAMPPPEAHAMPDEARPERRKQRRIVAAAMALLVIVGGGLAWFQPWAPREEPASIERMAFPLPDKPSIAVLPFTNMSDDSEQEYFVDGMTDDLITDLSKLSGLFVIARNSSFTYKGQSVKIRQVAEELGVRYVLEGSVRRAGDQVRINAQLIDATTGGHLWAERYDRKLIDVFALQDEVVQKIVSALTGALTPSEQLTLTRKYTDSLIAYDHFLRGIDYFFRGTKEENLISRESFQQAVEVDPGFARAYGMLARTHVRDFFNGWSDSRERALATGYKLAKKAVSLDESLPQAHFAVAAAARYRKEFADALMAIETAIGLDPNYADGYALLAQILQFGGRPKEALESLDKAVRLNPRHGFLYLVIRGQTYFTLGQYDRAIEAFEQSVERNPSSQRARMWLATSYAQAGRIEDAEWEADELLTVAPDFSVTRIGAAVPYRNPTHLAQFLDGLKKAGLPD
jgi:TolB-like protein/Flp pilus assembly protein TadD